MRKIGFIFLLLASLPAWCQLRDLRFTRLSVEDGLPENYPTCVLQDKKGYIWFGTQNGLVRYDGYKVKVYNLNTPDKIDRSYRSIWSILEDKKGAIWVATASEGVFRYNWASDDFTQFKHSEKDGRASKTDENMQLMEDKSGHIWSKALDGAKKQWHLDRIDPQSKKMETYDSLSTGKYHFPSTAIETILKDAAGDVWIGSNNGLLRFDIVSQKFVSYLNNSNDKTFRFINIYEAPSEPGIFWLTIYRKGKRNFGRFDIKTKTFKTYTHQSSDPRTLHSDSVFTVFEDRAKRLWMGTAKGISLFNRKTETFTAYLPQDNLQAPFANACTDIKEGRNGELWVLANRGGLLYLPNPQSGLVRYQYDETKPYGLPSNSLTNSFIDRTQNLWLGDWGNGLYRLDEKASQFETGKKTDWANGYPGGKLIASVSIGSNKYLVATRNGFFSYDHSTNRYTPISLGSNKAAQKYLSSLIVDKAGIAWLGTGYGLYRYDPTTNKVTSFKNNPADSLSLPNNYVEVIYEDRAGRLWVGTYSGGLCQLDRKSLKFKRFVFADNQSSPFNGVLDDDDVISLMEDSKGVLWVGTNNGGLNKLDKATGRFTSYFNQDQGFTCITSMYEDSKGRFWAGTYLWGVFLFDRTTGNFRRFTEKDGLAHEEVLLIKEDAAGKLWLGSHRGFSILDPDKFTVKTLTTANGLPQNDIASREVFDMNGRWMVGTDNGFFIFQPQAFTKDSTPPQVVLQMVSFTKSGSNTDSSIILDDRKSIELAYNENRLNFSFVGLHYNNPKLNQYQYKLEGYDKEWSAAGTQRFATYTNLSPGSYTFLVKGSNSDGVWTKEPTKMEVVIRPPWWQTWWAYALYALAVAMAIAGFIAYRSKALRRENKVLEDKVAHRTEQLQKSIENLQTTQRQLVQSEKMASLGELTAGIAHEIQNPLNFVNNFSEVSVELLTELEEEVGAGKNGEALAIASNLKQNLEKITHHGKRADSIVKSMLQHSRQSSGHKEPTDINALADEYLRLSYHGLRAKDKSFNATLETHFDPTVGKLEIMPQDIGRVLLNLFTNAFYSVQEKKKREGAGFEPTVTVSTRREGNSVIIQVKDNGTGIPQSALDKIYQPFFTTKPTGEGTGLGLSMSYDIITKGHGGALNARTKEGEYAEFDILLPA